ncbi:MAG: EFR1 family ferrodoxin [Erysipelotrichaceae bacterium]|nr:EFR1 family ferrodoxin [Erysipelotrichaceae bacterium]
MEVIYYSGTGNSRYVAQRTAKIINAECIDLKALIKDNKKFSFNSEDVVLVTPTYAWRIPKIVENYLLENDLSKIKRMWFLMSCGDEIGKASRYNEKLCEKLGCEYMGTGQINMPENYIAMFEVPDKQEAEKIVERANEKIDNFASLIADRKKLPANKEGFSDLVKSVIVNPLFYKVFVKADGFTVNEKCVSCGSCVNNCPLNNIELKDGKPSWGNNCTHCMACICYCPVEAIEYKNASRGKFRYRIEALDLKE